MMFSKRGGLNKKLNTGGLSWKIFGFERRMHNLPAREGQTSKHRERHSGFWLLPVTVAAQRWICTSFHLFWGQYLDGYVFKVPKVGPAGFEPATKRDITFFQAGYILSYFYGLAQGSRLARPKVQFFPRLPPCVFE
jgi:hypothetical protein